MTHLLLAAGMPRSGSTWLYNALRLLLQPPVRSGWVADYQPDHPAPVHLVKLHQPEAALAARAAGIFLSYREPLGLAASLWRMGFVTREEDLLPLLDRIAEDYRFWLPRARYVVDLAAISNQPQAVIQALHGALPIARRIPVMDPLSILAALEAMCHEGPEPYDPLTLLHVGHRRDGGSAGRPWPESLHTVLTENWLTRWPAPPPAVACQNASFEGG